MVTAYIGIEIAYIHSMDADNEGSPVGSVGSERNTTTDKFRAWQFTMFNVTNDRLAHLARLDQKFRVGGSIEKCSTSGREHFQGLIRFKNQVRFSTVKQTLPDGCHFEVCMNFLALLNYNSKADSHIAGPFGSLYPEARPWPKRGLLTQLRLWQWCVQHLLKLDPDDRTLLWLYDSKGGAGKTKFCKHILLSRPESYAYVCGRGQDCLYAVGQRVLDSAKQIKGVIFDYPRSTEGHVSYLAIEKLKDGIFFSGKYESRSFCLDYSPHCIVFSNQEPERMKMSGDRWRIINLMRDMEIQRKACLRD